MLGEATIIDYSLSFLPASSIDTSVANKEPHQQSQQLDPTLYDNLFKVLSDFIYRRCDYFASKEKMMAIIGSIEPLDKIAEILSVPETPLPIPKSASTPLLQDINSNKYSLDNSNTNKSSDDRKKRTNNWLPHEDRRLLMGLLKYGRSNWASISKFVGSGRTRSQCSQRWSRSLSPHIRKDKWDPEDDRKLLALVDQYGVRSWSKIARNLGSRSDVQCRYRYNLLVRNKNQAMLLIANSHSFPSFNFLCPQQQNEQSEQSEQSEHSDHNEKDEHGENEEFTLNSTSVTPFGIPNCSSINMMNQPNSFYRFDQKNVSLNMSEFSEMKSPFCNFPLFGEKMFVRNSTPATDASINAQVTVAPLPNISSVTRDNIPNLEQMVFEDFFAATTDYSAEQYEYENIFI